MADLCALGSVVNRILFFVLVVSWSLARDVHPTENPFEDREDRVERSASLVDDKSKSKETRPSKPDPCRSSINAMSIIREEYHVFSGKWFWRVNRQGMMFASDPTEISDLWYGLPHNVSQVDAVCERTPNGKIVFFSGSLYWELDDNRSGKFPKDGRPLTDLGFADDVSSVDAAFVSPSDKRTYVIAGDRMWKMNASGNGVEGVDHVTSLSTELPAPKSPIDAAFTTFEGKVYLVQGDYFLEVSDLRSATRSEVRLRNENPIFGCRRNSSTQINRPSVFSLSIAILLGMVVRFGQLPSPIHLRTMS